MYEMPFLTKISMFLMFACPVTAVIIYYSPLWKKICREYDTDPVNDKTQKGEL
jgi:hypothetical protein